MHSTDDALIDPEPASVAERLRVAASAEPVYPDDQFAGRGIVICAGGARLFTCAWLTIAFLRRHLGCSLPIEVWHIGPDEMGPPMRALLEALGAQTIDALEVARHHPVATLGGWQLKTYALLHSRFREILLLDADNLPVTDPEFLFTTAEYQQTGAIFWPDIVRLRASNHIWATSGLKPDSGPSFESGQVVIDKARHWRTLHLADWINQHHRLFEDMLYGDKDAFYVAWHLAGRPFHLIAQLPRQLEHTLCQRGPDGLVLFQHRSGVKWMLHGHNPRVEGFRFEEQCFELLTELRLLWDGSVFNPPERSGEARAIERALIATRQFRLVWQASHERMITLLPGHRIGKGTTDKERCWFVADGEVGPELRVVGRGALTFALRAEPDGIWRGAAGGFSVELQPAVPGYAASATQAGADEAWLRVIDAALAAGSRLSPQAAATQDYVVTLATLAALHDAALAHLRARATDPAQPMQAAALATAALAATHGDAPREAIQPGTGWMAPSGSLAHQYEALRKR